MKKFDLSGVNVNSVLLLTTVQGLEKLVLEEFKELCKGIKIRGVDLRVLRGRVYIAVDEENIERILKNIMYGSRLIERVRILLGEVKGLDIYEMRRKFSSIFNNLLNSSMYFAVKAERLEDFENLTSVELASKIGKVLEDATKAKVSLDDPDLLVYAEAERNVVRFGIDITGFLSLRNRDYRIFKYKTMLNPIIASAMCRLSKPHELMLDPMCGSGTIPIECLYLYPSLRVICGDINPDCTRGAVNNASAAGFSVEGYIGDINFLPLYCGEIFDSIITNPPFGIREKAVRGLKSVYRSLLDVAESILIPGGRLCLITTQMRMLRWLLRKHDKLSLINYTKIIEGGLVSYIVVIQKRLH